MSQCRLPVLIFSVLMGLYCGRAFGDGRKEVDFIRDVRPILSNHCFRCHGPDAGTREAGLRLDTREGATEDFGGYRAIQPGDSAVSEALKRILHDDPDLRMPPPDVAPPLTPEQIDILRRWIEQGAHYKEHWAFHPVTRPPVPVLKSPSGTDWGSNAIDAFILEKLAGQGISPSSEAPRETLIRRVFLDVTGLPPTLKEIDAYLSDPASDAYERMVERALASPHYGERWGRHWLDQARYADTHGYTVDTARSMWLYRDWVIDALNEDRPFDQFTIEQLAGDLLPQPTQKQLIATGFHRNTLVNQEGGVDNEQFRVETVVDRVNTTGAVWLGLTVACAQCHTHKYDPLTHREYYQLYAFFNSSEDVNNVGPTVRFIPLNGEQRLEGLDRQIQLARDALADHDRRKREIRSDEEHRKLKQDLENKTADRKKLADSFPTTMIMRELDKPRPTHVLIRGDFLRHGESVLPDTPAFLPPMSRDPVKERSTRLDLARWLVAPSNPLTPRVYVNRVWSHYFGRGLVDTENDFGIQGTPPTHPELLDWLASEFVDSGWSMKQMHRLILTSATYRQSSRQRDDLNSQDPLNLLLARQNRLRVEAEIVRDSGLAASGLLHRQIGGPSVYPPQPDGVYAFTQSKMAWPTSQGDQRYRRGLYTFFRRSAPYPLLTTFDSPAFNTTCTARVRSNTPLQALTLANDPAMFEIAAALGRHLQQVEGGDDSRIEYAFRRCLGRVPDDVERDRLTRYLKSRRNQTVDEQAVWTHLARVLMNLDEFITRE